MFKTAPMVIFYTVSDYLGCKGKPLRV